MWPALGQGRLLLPLFLRPFSGGAQNHKASLRKLARLTRGGGWDLNLLGHLQEALLYAGGTS